MTSLGKIRPIGLVAQKLPLPGYRGSGFAIILRFYSESDCQAGSLVSRGGGTTASIDIIKE